LSAARSSPPPASALKGLDGRRVGRDGSSLGGGGGSGWRRRRVLLLAPAVIGASGRRPPMRLLAGWLCLSLASVWLARRMWTLRGPLARSLCVNVASGPGGPAAAAGGRKENHQVWSRTRTGPGGAGAGRPAFPRSARLLCGALRREAPPGLAPPPRPLAKFPPHRLLGRAPGPRPAAPFVRRIARRTTSGFPPGPRRERPGAPHCSRVPAGDCRCSATSASAPGGRPEELSGRRVATHLGPIWHRGLRTE